MKGFQRLIPLMRYLPEVDLRIAGTGPVRAGPARAGPRPARTCSSRGCSAARRWPGCFAAPARWSCRRCSPRRSATSCSRRSRCGTPVVVHEGGGALYETGFLSGGGLGYRTDTELLTALRRIVHDHGLHDELAARGYRHADGRMVRDRASRPLLQPDRPGAGVARQQPYPRPHALAGAPRSRRVVDIGKDLARSHRRRAGFAGVASSNLAYRQPTREEPSAVPHSAMETYRAGSGRRAVALAARLLRAPARPSVGA